MAKRKDLGFQILSRVGRNGSGWLSDMQIHSPAHPELSLHFPALASPHHHPPPSLSCTVSSSSAEWRSHVTLSPCPFCPMLKKARPGPYPRVPSPNEAQDLCSGVLGVSPTLIVTGAPYLQKRKHRCPKCHRPPGHGLARAEASQADPASSSLPPGPSATPACPPGVRSEGARNLP